MSYEHNIGNYQVLIIFYTNIPDTTTGHQTAIKVLTSYLTQSLLLRYLGKTEQLKCYI